MKRLIPLIIVVLTSSSMFAQISLVKDTVNQACIMYNVSTNIHQTVNNNSNVKQPLKWTVGNLALPNGWTVESICDNVGCYSPTQSGFYSPHTSDSVMNGQTMDLKLALNLSATADSGTGYVIVQVVGNNSSSVNAVFRANTCAPAAVSYINSADGFYVYVEDNASNLIVVTGSDLKKKTIEIYNILGTKVKSMTNSESINKIDVQNLASGQYVVRLLDANQSTLAVRKVIIN